MSDTMISLYEFFQANWAKLLLIITTPIVGGISIWQLLMFFVNLVKNNTAKKYFKPLSTKYAEIKAEFEKMQDSFKTMIAEFKAENADNIKAVIADFMASYENTKKLIYNDIINADDTLKELNEETSTIVVLDNEEQDVKEEPNNDTESVSKDSLSRKEEAKEENVSAGEML